MASLSSDYLPAISQKNLTKTLQFAVANGFFEMIAGDTGTGKTEIMMQSCLSVTPDMLRFHPSVELGYKPTGVSVLYIMCSNYDEWSMRGVQSFKDTVIDEKTGKIETVTVTAMPEWFRAYQELRLRNPNNIIVIILDEIAVGVIQLQASLLQLITQKAINEQEIPDKEKPLVSFLAAYNRPQDHPVTYNMTAPLAMRAHGAYVLEPQLQDWFDYMDSVGTMHPLIFDTLTKNPEYFHISDIQNPKNENQRIPTVNCVKPRNWSQLCDKCNSYFMQRDVFNLDDKDLHRMFQSRVPAEVATALMASYKVVGQLTDIKEIQANPDTAKLDKNMLMQTLQLYNVLGQVDDKTVDAAIVYMNRMEPAVKGIITSKILSTRRSGIKSKLPSKVVAKMIRTFIPNSLDNINKLRGVTSEDNTAVDRMKREAAKSTEEARGNTEGHNPDLEIEI